MHEALTLRLHLAADALAMDGAQCMRALKNNH